MITYVRETNQRPWFWEKEIGMGHRTIKKKIHTISISIYLPQRARKWGIPVYRRQNAQQMPQVSTRKQERTCSTKVRLTEAITNWKTKLCHPIVRGYILKTT